jgi:two-component system, NarL family, nitrate/nitrite response regulator NarL
VVSTAVPPGPESSGIPARILVAGSDLLADALASALETYGFATKSIVASAPAIEGGIDWRPDLVLLDARSLEIPRGVALIDAFRQAGVQICIIDAVDNNDRLNAWLRAGTSALIDKGDPFDHLFRTITALLRSRLLARTAPRYLATLALTAVDDLGRERLELFGALTEREQGVLAELIEGHCAEDIAKAAFVSISTVRSQIKAILQKLGVGSQLAAVAMARRAGWSFEGPSGTPPDPSSSRRRQVS